MIRNAVPRAQISRSILFICDIQERFRSVIHKMPNVIHQSSLLYKSCQALNVEAIVTEHYPKVMGPTVPEMEIQPNTKLFSKTKFSM